MRRLILALSCMLLPALGRAQDQLPSDVSFALRRSFLEELLTAGPNGRSVGARWTTDLRMGQRSNVHALSADCELHVGARMPNNRVIAAPRGIVVEPPNVCKMRVPQIAQNGSIKTAWQNYFDQNVVDKPCRVTGFPRIFSEHATGAGEEGTGGSNPDHVVEIHPVTQMVCGGETVDYLPLVKIFPGMRQISDASASACIEKRKLFVRQRGSGTQIRYEFLEEGALGGGGRCGNFVVVSTRIGKEYLRVLSNGGDHAALARVTIGDDGPFPLKIYTYAGTSVDGQLAALMANTDENAEINVELHGLITYDYFTIAQAVQEDQADSNGNFPWLPATQLREYKEIRRPLSLIVFGPAAN